MIELQKVFKFASELQNGYKCLCSSPGKAAIAGSGPLEINPSMGVLFWND